MSWINNVKKGIISFTLLGLVGCATLLGPDLKPGLEASRAGEHKAALAYYQTLIKEGQANAEVYRLGFEAAFRSGNRQQAAGYYTEALAKDFDQDSLKNLAVSLWYERALWVMGADRWQDAEQAAKQISDLKPDSREAKFCELILAGQAKYDKGAHKGLWDALGDFTRAASLAPNSGLPYYLMARTRYKNDHDDYAPVIENYQRALELEPNGSFAKDAAAELKRLKALQKKMKAFWGN